MEREVVEMEVDAPSAELVKTEVDRNTVPEAVSDSKDVKSTEPFDLPKDPITPFRSFLRPNERQHRLAGTSTRRQIPGGSMATPERVIA